MDVFLSARHRDAQVRDIGVAHADTRPRPVPWHASDQNRQRALSPRLRSCACAMLHDVTLDSAYPGGTGGRGSGLRLSASTQRTSSANAGRSFCGDPGSGVPKMIAHRAVSCSGGVRGPHLPIM